MSDKPSYMTSTFSILTIVVILGFVILCIWMKDIGNLKEVAMLVLGGYGVKKGIEVGKNGVKPEEKPHEPVLPTPS